VVPNDDVRPLQEALAAGQFEQPGAVGGRCSVTGGTECDVLDIVLVGRVTTPGGANIEPSCDAANP
jgi:hypothetical protein